MFPIIWLEASLVWAARTVPTASSKSGTLACCTASTAMFRTASGDGVVRVCSLEQPTRLNTAGSIRKRKLSRIFIRFMASPREIADSSCRWLTPGWRSWSGGGKWLPSSRSGCGAPHLQRPTNR